MLSPKAEASMFLLAGCGNIRLKLRGHILAPTRKTIAALREKLPSLEPWWRKTFGHGFEALTESELNALHRYNSTDAVRDRLASETRKTGLGGSPRGPGSG